MSGRRLWILAAVFGLAGCCGTAKRASQFPPQRPLPCDNCGPAGAPPTQRLSPFPVDPATGTTAPPTYLPPYTPAPTTGNPGPVGLSDPRFRPVIDPAVRPALDARVRLDGPQQYRPESAYAQIRLDVPVPVRPDAGPPVPPVKPLPPANDLAVRPDPRETQEPPPVDIPQFAVVRARVASGQQPFPDGIAWLQSKGYRTALHLRPPGEDANAARKQFEKRGLQYVSLEVAPGALTKELAEQFKNFVADETNLPLFVYDRDGALTGGLWYLHFRLNGVPDDKALAEANRLGFRPDQDDEHKAMLKAARELLVSMPKP